jgi:2-aminoethylphosphonate-pyruvate transaminase
MLLLNLNSAIRRSRRRCMLMIEPAQSSVVLPAGVAYTKLHGTLNGEGFVIYAGQGDLSKVLFRISTMGRVSSADLSRLLKCCAQSL